MRPLLLGALTLAGAAAGAAEQSPAPSSWPIPDSRDPFGLGTRDVSVAQLVEKLRDPNPNVRATAALWLSARSDLETAVPALIAALDDPAPSVRMYACHAVGRAQAREAAPRLIALLEGDGENRREAAQALGALGPSAESVSALLRALDRQDLGRDTRAAIVSALGAVGNTPEVVGRLAAFLTDPEDAVRVAAQGALAGMGSGLEAALPALILAVQQPNGLGRRHAAIVLARLGPAGGPAVPALFGLVEDRDPEVRKAAVAAIRAIRLHRPRPLS